MSLTVVVSATDLSAGEEIHSALSRGSDLVVHIRPGFIRPAGLLGLATAALDAMQSGAHLRIRRATSPSGDAYLEAVGFYRLLVEHGIVLIGSRLLSPPVEAAFPLVRCDPNRPERLVRALDELLRSVGLGDDERIRARVGLASAFAVIAGSGLASGMCVGETYHDPNGWLRLELAVGDIGPELDEDMWDEWRSRVLAWRLGGAVDKSSRFGLLIRDVLTSGSGSLAVRSSRGLLFASTREGTGERREAWGSGLQIGLLLSLPVVL